MSHALRVLAALVLAQQDTYRPAADHADHWSSTHSPITYSSVCPQWVAWCGLACTIVLFGLCCCLVWDRDTGRR
jgi:hypothetical protein